MRRPAPRAWTRHPYRLRRQHLAAGATAVIAVVLTGLRLSHGIGIVTGAAA